jgi:hypothetical protein
MLSEIGECKLTKIKPEVKLQYNAQQLRLGDVAVFENRQPVAAAE